MRGSQKACAEPPTLTNSLCAVPRSAQAAVICRHCPVMQQCAADALDNQVEYGVWGGLTERQRRALLKEHPDVVSWSEFLEKRNNRSIG